MQEQVTGYDVRIAAGAARRYWDPARRSTYLLDERVESPLSVDPLVWPSLFDLGHGAGMAQEERERLGLAGALGPDSLLPAWVGENHPLWDTREALRTYLAGLESEAPPAALIAVTLCSESRARPELPDTWERLGYDVGDGSFTSALSNCGYLAAEAADLRLAWAPHLNRHHLFEHPEDALRFALLADRRVPEHAPFFVYGLYLVESLP